MESRSASPNGQIDGESVSGDVSFKFAAVPAGDFDVQSFGGDIKNCFGPKPAQARFRPGPRLQFTSGNSHTHVRIATKSGNVELCAKGASVAADAGADAVAGADVGGRLL